MSIPQPGLTSRLVLALMLMAVTVVILDTVLTRWAFQSRFLSYVNEQEREAVEQLAERLAEFHLAHGDWTQLDQRRDLARLVQGSSREMFRSRIHEALREEALLQGPMPDELRLRLRTTRMLLPRLHLYDADGEPVVSGRRPVPDGVRPYHASIVADGRIVGRVTLAPLQTLAHERDLRFAREHMRTMWWIAALAVGLAGGVGFLLARQLLAPVRALAAGARGLAEGRYETRLDIRRRDELGSLARDFNLLAAGLEASRESRRRWLADVAHELRTPLTVLRAEIEALRDGIRPANEATLGALAVEAARLGALVDDLHELSLADAGALAYHFAPIDAAELVRSSAERFHPRMQQAGLSLECDLPARAAVITGDFVRLEQLLANLLENSLRYADPPGAVRLEVEITATDVLIHVDDGPPGVPTDEIEALFERFARRQAARDRASGGVGLGLPIARRIAEAHGGTLTATASTRGGLRVTLCLPRSATEHRR